MTSEFYGPTVAARASISRILNLSVTGREQDWEVEFADFNRLPEMLTLLRDGSLKFDEQCALALLALHSLEEMASKDFDVGQPIAELRLTLAQREDLRESMRFYWRQIGADEAVASVLA